ncbi:MAG TPA: glycosyltransferase family 39 protein [Haliangiales bacterium]|nr:glycosyltransferase family 39 protein [Haliangiales bacterium]
MGRIVAEPAAEGKNSAWIALGIAIATAALLAIGTGAGSLINGDEATYALFARGLRQGDYLHLRLGDTIMHQRPPLYPWLLALSTGLLGETAFALRLPSVLAGGAAAAFTCLLGERLWGRRAGIVAGLLFATLALAYLYGRAVVSDMTLTAFVVASIYLAATRRWLGAGLALGAALLVKQVVGLLPLVAPVALAWGREGPRRRDVLVLAAAAALIWAPWHVAMTVLDGRAFWAGYLGTNVLRRAGESLIAPTGPGYYLEILWRHEGPLVLLAAAGLAFAAARAWRRRAGDALVLLWLVGVVGAFTLASSRIEYYLLPAYPALALAMVRPLALLRPALAAAAGAALVAASAVAHLPQRIGDTDRSPEIRALAGAAAPDVVVDDLPMAPELYGGRRVTTVVTRLPNYVRVLQQAFLDPTRVVWIPPEALPAFLLARPGAVVLEPKAQLRHPLPPGARVVGETARYVLYRIRSPGDSVAR